MRTRGSGESALLLLDVIDLLVGAKIDYAVIGALAASVHGTVRASMDADVVVSVGMRAAGDLERKFRTSGYDASLSRGDIDDPIPGMLQLRDRHDNRVDLLLGLRGMEQDAFSRAIQVAFQGAMLQFIGREDFIAMKVFAGGPIDLIDAERAISAGGVDVDLVLLRRLARQFGRDASESLERLLAPT